VIIDKDFTVEEHARITTVREREADEENEEDINHYIDFGEDAFDSEDDEAQPSDKEEGHISVTDTASAVGPNGRGMRYQLPPNLINNRLNFLGVNFEELEGEEDEEDEEEERLLQKTKKEIAPKEPEPLSQDTRGMYLF
jgi:hypothetical protein